METFTPKVMPGKKLHSQAREIIWRVSEFMRHEVKQPNNALPVNKCLERAAAACGVSIGAVKKIRKEKKDINISPEAGCSFSTPKKKKRFKAVTDIDDFDKCVIRRTVNNFYKTEKSLPTLNLLKNKLSKDLNFIGSVSSLRTIIKELGFKWKKIENNRKVLIERSDIRAKRIDFLKQIRKCRQEKRPIVYMDESYVLSSHVSQRGWCDGSLEGYKSSLNKGQRAIIVHAGGDMGFIPNACLVWKAGTTDGDYHDQMNHDNFMMWTKNQLLPNLPPNSTIVIDNASYHNVEVNKAPNSNSKKVDMINWLCERGIEHDSKAFKPELYSLIKLHKDHNKVFVFDNLLKQSGHFVLRLPPYHPDLNPIEMIWGIIKNHVAQKNVTNKMDDTIALCKNKIEEISVDEWKKVCNKVIQLEIDYLEKEHLIDETTERLIIHLGSDSEDSDSGEESDEDTDMPLATAL